MVMSVFDLLFLFAALVSVITLIAAAVMAISGNGRRALRLLKGWAISAAAYVAIAAVVGFALPLKTFHLGDEQCEDDWCLTVDSAARVSPDTYQVVLRMSSHARRVSQRNRNGLTVSLVDQRGARYPAVPGDNEIPFDVLLEPGQSVTTMRTFHVPRQANGLGLVVGHEGWNFPTPLIIGREPFQKTVVLLEALWAFSPPMQY